ncbi:MAG: sulfite exporter TauE/SafE family protein [bacterium]
MPLPVQLLVLFLVGIVCGFINILAGGGSLLTLPVLIFLGLPTAVANGTNRIGILIQNVAAIFGFHQQNVFPWRVSLLAALPAIAGSIIGAQLAIDVPDDLFKRLLAGIMIGVLLIMILDPTKRLRAQRRPMTWWRGGLFAFGFFGVGLFGGFIQAGVGFLIILLMLLEGFDLVAINAVKVFVVFIFTLAALAVFMYHQQVHYVLGGALGLGNALGGWLATRFAVKKGHDWIRGFVIVTVIVFSIQLVIDSFR